MSNLSYKLMSRRQNLQIKIYAILSIILVFAVSGYSYLKWQEYSSVNALLSGSEDLISNLRTNLNETNARYSENRDGFSDLKEDIDERLDYIFPATDDYTDLTRQFDSYEKELATVREPFEVSHIDYQAPIEEKNYTILPVRMTIRSSSQNFQAFLHLLENSGALDEEVRLMDISSIRLNFEGTDDNVTAPEIINFTVQLNAYFQKVQ